MNKIAIPALLVATVMVAGMFAFMPVEQASTVHLSGTTIIDITSLTGAGDIDNTELNTALTTINNFLDTEVQAILDDTAAMEPLITTIRMAELDAGNLPTDITNVDTNIEATQTQIASLVTTDSAVDPTDGTTTTNTELLSAANNKAGIAYVTLTVNEDGGTTGNITVDVQDGTTTVGSITAVDGVDTQVIQTFAFATDGTGIINIDESAGGDTAGETWSATIVVIATIANP